MYLDFLLIRAIRFFSPRRRRGDNRVGPGEGQGDQLQHLQHSQLKVRQYFYRTRVRSLGMLVSDWLTHSLTPWRLVNLIDATLVCKDANSILVEVVTVADVDDEHRVGNSLLQIWSWRLVIKLTFCSDFEHKGWSRFWSWRLAIKLNFCSDFEHKGWSRFWSWSSGKILKLEFVQHFDADVL